MLALSFLGTFDTRWNDDPIRGFESGKVRALLAYLVMEAGRPHSRDHLAGMFWAEFADEAANKNLRQALSNLRKTIRDDGSDSPLLTVTPVSIQADLNPNLRLDTDEFNSLLAACAAHPHRRPETCTACAARMRKALGLYRGAFLEGFFLKEANAFQDWLAARREAFRQRAVDALYGLIAFHRRRGEVKAAIIHARRLVSLDPWREEAHAELIRLLAQDGQRSAALKQYEECRKILAKELEVEPQKETRELYEQIKSGDLPMDVIHPAPNNLPQEATTFIGRQTELEQIADLLQRTDSRLVTLTGLGGVGKTRLALRAACQQVFAFQDGVFWLPLAELTDASSLLSLLAETIGFHFSSTENPQAQLLEYLKPREVLLVLDNFEHILEGSGFLSDILQACPYATLLITSREPLRLQTEWIFDVNGLDASFPPLEPDTVISSSDSLRLFEERARRVRKNFSLTEETILQVRELCQLLNGLPLGIEIAAALCGRFALTEIHARIHQNLDFLTAATRDLPERHRSVRSVFDQSWNLLNPEFQRVLARLSVFRGGFSLQAAQAVSLAQAEQLASLVDKSLLAFDGKETYSLHELVRQYCAEPLRESAEAEEVSTRFIAYFADFVSDREPRLYTEDQKSAIQEIETNFHHIREAWHLAGQKRLADSLNRMFGGVHFYLDLRGQLLDGDMLYGEAISHLQDPVFHEGRLTLSKLLVGQGWFNFRLGNVEKAWTLLNDNIGLFRELQAGSEAAFALNYLGIVARERGDYPNARKFHEESLMLYKQADNPKEIAKALNNLGLVVQKIGDLNEAGRLFQESYTLRSQLGDRRGTSISLTNLGAIHNQLGRLNEARECFDQCLVIDRDLGDQYGIAISLYHLGDTALCLGEFSSAESHLMQSLEMTRNMSERPIIVITLIALAELYRKTGRKKDSLEFLREGMTLAREIQAIPSVARILLEYAEFAMDSQHWDIAADIAAYVLEVYPQNADNKNMAGDVLARLDKQLPREKTQSAVNMGKRRSSEDVEDELVSRLLAGSW